MKRNYIGNNNEINKKKYKKSLPPKLNPNAGNVEHNIDMFNKMTNASADGIGTGLNSAAGMNGMAESYNREDLIDKIKAYGKEYKFDKYKDYQLAAILNRLSSRSGKIPMPDPTNKKHSTPINDPKYNYDDPDREGDYVVENLNEALNRIDRRCMDKGETFYDLRQLYENAKHVLTPQEKTELKNLVNTTNDPDAIRAYLDSKQVESSNKNLMNTDIKEDYADEHTSYPTEDEIYAFLDDVGGYAGYTKKISLLCKEFNLSRQTAEKYLWSYIHNQEDKQSDLQEKYKKDDDDVPYTQKQVKDTLSKLTKDFTETEGAVRCWYEQEKKYAMEVLKKHYKVVEPSDGRQSKNDKMNWVIAYSGVKKDVDENANFSKARKANLKENAQPTSEQLIELLKKILAKASNDWVLADGTSAPLKPDKQTSNKVYYSKIAYLRKRQDNGEAMDAFDRTIDQAVLDVNKKFGPRCKAIHNPVYSVIKVK